MPDHARVISATVFNSSCVIFSLVQSSSLTLSLELLAVGVVSIFCTSRLTFSYCCTLGFLAGLLFSFSSTLRPFYCGAISVTNIVFFGVLKRTK